MRLKHISITAALCLSAYLAGAQNASFLNNPSDARSAAMGDAGYVLSGGVASSRNNTAGMLSSGYRAAAEVAYANWQPDLLGAQTWGFGGYYLANSRLGFMAGVKLNSMDSYMRTDDNGNQLGDFTPKEQAFELGAAYGVTDRFALGATLRYVGSDIGGPDKASAFAADVHLFYDLDRLRLGLGVTNIGSKLDYGHSDNDLPARIRAGAAYRFEPGHLHSLTATAAVDYQIMPDGFTGIEGGLGVEYMYNNLVAVRGGYHLADKEKTGESYGSVGCGINLWDASLDFAYILAGSDSFMKNSLMVSLGYKFR